MRGEGGRLEGIIELLPIIQFQDETDSSATVNDYLLYPGKDRSPSFSLRQRHYPLAGLWAGPACSPLVHRARRRPAARFVNLMSGQWRYWSRPVITAAGPVSRRRSV